jgi:hypothetical protein
MAAGTKDDPWRLTTPPGTSDYTMYLEGDALVCRVGSTTLKYRARAIDDLHDWLIQQGDWVPLGSADESMPCAIGICTIVSAAASASGVSPSPSAPSTSASLSGATKSRRLTASGLRASAAIWNPDAVSSRLVEVQSPRRVHGTCSTVPIDTRMARR